MRREWWISLGGVMLAAALWFQSSLHLAADDSVTLVFTIVPADSRELACSSGPIFGRRCEFDEVGAPQATAAPLRPFVTTGGEVVLLSGVFEDAHVARWLGEALQTNRNDRVTVSCAAKLDGVSGPVRIRWKRADGWSTLDKLTAASVANCVVQ